MPHIRNAFSFCFFVLTLANAQELADSSLAFLVVDTPSSQAPILDSEFGADSSSLVADSSSTQDRAEKEAAAETGKMCAEDLHDSVRTDTGLVDSFAWDRIDTTHWDTLCINAWHFESAKWQDTARLVLVDSLLQKAYFHPHEGRVTSGFGKRRQFWHYGVDVKLQRGDTVRVAFSGIVRVIQYDRRGYGHVVVVRHADGLETVYGHLSRKLVVTNQRVVGGEAIGLGGSTGRSTGSHLHFEVRYLGEPFDPTYIVDFDSCRLKSDTLVLNRANFEYLVELRKRKWCTIRSGDTLGHIALRYGTTVGKLCSLNGISRRTILRLGRKLRYQ